MKLRPIKYEWNALHNQLYGSSSDTQMYGFLAQELKEVIPTMISQGADGYYWYNPSGFEAILTAGMQELDAKMMRFAADRGKWGLDDEGYVVIDKLKVAEIKVTGDRTIGRAMIRQNDQQITVKAPAVRSNTAVFVTFLTDMNAQTWHVENVIADVGFAVRLSAPAISDYEFRWLLVDADEGGELQYSSEPVISETPSQSPPISDEVVAGGEGGGEVAGETTPAETPSPDPSDGSTSPAGGEVVTGSETPPAETSPAEAPDEPLPETASGG